MLKQCAAVVVVLLLALACVSLAFLLVGKTRSDITLHFVEIVKGRGGFVVSLALSNHTEHVGGFIPLRLEQMEEGMWKPCPDGIGGYSLSHDPDRNTTLACVVKRVPGRLRLVAQCRVQLKGLDSYLRRLRLRFVEGKKIISVFPRERTFIFYSPPQEIISDEFVEPYR